MKLHSVRLSGAAETDLIRLYEWVHGAAGEAVADRFYGRLRQAIESLQYFPERGVLRESIAPAARLLVVGNHVVLYRVAGNAVDVIRVVYGAVDLTRLLR